MIISDGRFKCLKIYLIVFHVLALIGYVIFVGITAFTLHSLQNLKPTKGYIQTDIDVEKNIQINAILILAIFLVINILGLVAVWRDHLVTMIIVTVLNVLKIIYQIIFPSARAAWFSVLLAVIWAFMNGFFAYLIHKRKRVGNSAV